MRELWLTNSSLSGIRLRITVLLLLDLRLGEEEAFPRIQHNRGLSSNRYQEAMGRCGYLVP